jgi:hypothetical protein
MDFRLSVMGIDCRTLKIDQIVSDDDPTMGLSRRICYEISPGDDEDAFQLLKKHFCLTQNSDFNLCNAVVKVNTHGRELVMGDNLGSNTGGSIIVDGPVRLGTFKQSSEPEKAPLLIMSEKGEITVKNSANPTLAYLVAMNKEKGQIKFASQDQPIKLLGGIAASTVNPADISRGGSIIYNSRFDPTKEDFAQHVGVVIGRQEAINDAARYQSR